MSKKSLEKIIEKKLTDTINHCEFKRAWLPKGWACIKIKTFAQELAAILKAGKTK